MKRTLIALALAQTLTPALAQDSGTFTPFRGEDWGRQLLWTGLTIVDHGQTLHIAKRPLEFEERNPILGPHPSEKSVNTFFAIQYVAMPLIAWMLPTHACLGSGFWEICDWRETFQNTFIVFRAGMVANNIAIGAKIDF